MKDKLLKALFVAIAVAVGITLVTIAQNESFSLTKAGLYAIVAFLVDFGFTHVSLTKEKVKLKLKEEMSC